MIALFIVTAPDLQNELHIQYDVSSLHVITFAEMGSLCKHGLINQ